MCSRTAIFCKNANRGFGNKRAQHIICLTSDRELKVSFEVCRLWSAIFQNVWDAPPLSTNQRGSRISFLKKFCLLYRTVVGSWISVLLVDVIVVVVVVVTVRKRAQKKNGNLSVTVVCFLLSVDQQLAQICSLHVWSIGLFIYLIFFHLLLFQLIFSFCSLVCLMKNKLTKNTNGQNISVIIVSGYQKKVKF